MKNSKTEVSKVRIDYISGSDRWIYREYTKDNRLIGVNFQQGIESIDDKDWQVSDKKLLCIIVAISGTTPGRLQVSLDTLDGLLWRYFMIMDAIDNTDESY